MKATLCVLVALVAVTSALPSFVHSNRRGTCAATGWCAAACKCDTGASADDCTGTNANWCTNPGGSGAVTPACSNTDGTVKATAACKCGSATVTTPAAKKVDTAANGYCLLETASSAANIGASTGTCAVKSSGTNAGCATAWAVGGGISQASCNGADIGTCAVKSGGTNSGCASKTTFDTCNNEDIGTCAVRAGGTNSACAGKTTKITCLGSGTGQGNKDVTDAANTCVFTATAAHDCVFTPAAANACEFTATAANDCEYTATSQYASTDTCPSVAATADKVLNTKVTCGSNGGINGCASGKVCIGGACLSACSNTAGAAVSGSACACGTTKADVGTGCYVVSGVAYVTAKPACSNLVGATAVSADCTCGYKSGSTVAITYSSSADKFCYVGTTGKGFVTDAAQPACASTNGSADSTVAACSCGTTDIIKVAQNKVCKITNGVASEENKKCASSDGSAAESAACTCGNNCAAVASGAVCRVVNSVGYSTAKPVCSNLVGATAVSADCTCGYKSGSTVAITYSSSADKFCYVGTTGKGFVTDAAQPACASTNGSADSTVAACSCGTTDIIKVAQNKVCKITNGVASEENKKCASSDG